MATAALFLASCGDDSPSVADKIVTGAGAGGGPAVRVFEGEGGPHDVSLTAFGQGFRGGVDVAVGDVDDHGNADIIAAAGRGGAPTVKVFESDGSATAVQFSAFDRTFRGGARVASGDLDGEGGDEIVVGAGPGGGPEVRVFDTQGRPTDVRFLAFGPEFRGGVDVAVGDVDGDDDNEIIVGAGRGGGPVVKVFEADGSATPTAITAFDPSFAGGVNVAAGDVDGDDADEIVVGAGRGGGPEVRIFEADGSPAGRFLAFHAGFRGGVDVAAGDVLGDDEAEVIAGAGRGGGPAVRVFDADGSQLSRFMAYGETFRGGVRVASGD